MDAFVKRRSELHEVSHFRDPFLLSIPQSAYKDLGKEVLDNNRYYIRKSGIQIWRTISPEPIVLDHQGEVTDATAENGYWIWGDYGDKYELDNKPLSHVTCFGSASGISIP
jgi:hypothetical protein